MGTATITVSQPGTPITMPRLQDLHHYSDREESLLRFRAGLVMWLDGKDVNGDRLAESASYFLAGGKVGSWADRSGNANTRPREPLPTSPPTPPEADWTLMATISDRYCLHSLSGNPGFTAIMWLMQTSKESRCLALAVPVPPTSSLYDNGKIGYTSAAFQNWFLQLLHRKSVGYGARQQDQL